MDGTGEGLIKRRVVRENRSLRLPTESFLVSCRDEVAPSLRFTLFLDVFRQSRNIATFFWERWAGDGGFIVASRGAAHPVKAQRFE